MTEAKPFKVFIAGKPVPKGSYTAMKFKRKTGADGVFLKPDTSDALTAWTIAIKAACSGKVPVAPHGTAVVLQMDFYFIRPQSHFNTKGRRISAPNVYAKKPDFDKLARAVADALTGIAYQDDEQVNCCLVNKFWIDPGESPVTMQGMVLTISTEV